jgi:hypothetical protein
VALVDFRPPAVPAEARFGVLVVLVACVPLRGGCCAGAGSGGGIGPPRAVVLKSSGVLRAWVCGHEAHRCDDERPRPGSDAGAFEHAAD